MDGRAPWSVTSLIDEITATSAPVDRASLIEIRFGNKSFRCRFAIVALKTGHIRVSWAEPTALRKKRAKTVSENSLQFATDNTCPRWHRYRSDDCRHGGRRKGSSACAADSRTAIMGMAYVVAFIDWFRQSAHGGILVAMISMAMWSAT
jgi:hypothetical protein